MKIYYMTLDQNNQIISVGDYVGGNIQELKKSYWEEDFVRMVELTRQQYNILSVCQGNIQLGFQLLNEIKSLVEKE